MDIASTNGALGCCKYWRRHECLQKEHNPNVALIRRPQRVPWGKAHGTCTFP